MRRTAVIGLLAALSVLAVLAGPATGQGTMADDGEPITGANATVTNVSASATPNPAPPEGTITLSASAENATRYAWDVDDDGIGEYVGQTVSWTPNGTGSYTVAVRATNISNDADDYAETNITVKINETADSPLGGTAGEYDTNGDGTITARELGNAVTDFGQGELNARELGEVVTAFGQS